ncbi:AAA family ATPase [Neorhizobium galegae]|uniref:AAA family ATPase n=1 Tax=Neorhizobium galegae TaxID=399 RepID=UPI001F20798C|nr:AAA family ATPase [Neorhizobium galegae]UIK04817.1 AAA family ATPase [Neorhizobium galegae]
MRIEHIEIGNFRKLQAVRVDFAEEKTIFVGANNSGKTSAMVALRYFLVDSTRFSINDFTLSHWRKLNESAAIWEAAAIKDEPIPKLNWEAELPFLDVWIQVEEPEFHHVQKLLPTLDWKGGKLGVRLRFEPKEPELLQGEFLKARLEILKLLKGHAGEAVAEMIVGDEATALSETIEVSLWPQTMMQFLERRLRSFFECKAYLLDPEKLVEPIHGIARPQTLTAANEALDGDPFKDLICVDEINAQRGFGHPSEKRSSRENGEEETVARSSRKLSAQLKNYYANHLDPSRAPGLQDLKALQAIEKAQETFDERLRHGFSAALKELEELNYPGITDPKLTITTRIKPTDGLNHDSAVQYEVGASGNGSAIMLRLPEDSNGLGYQNLVSMVFGLMSFRDAWMKVGKAMPAKEGAKFPPPLHLVLVEEPEAHLHAQVQQVFIKQAYAILRKNEKLGTNKQFSTQLVVSTHSSHVAHECEFSSLRYFRRLPASAIDGAVPTSAVINLSEIFGATAQTDRFVTRYLKATHCDLFFADAAIFIEGPAERILVPYLVHSRPEYEFLRKCYISWLEIGGSHAHKLKPLIERLGLTTLIVTDLDAKEALSDAKAIPQRNQGQRARNDTLKTWHPVEESLDVLLDKTPVDLIKTYPNQFSIRVAYQQPSKIAWPVEEAEVISNTFEDALVYDNVAFFKSLSGPGLIAKFRTALCDSTTIAQLQEAMASALEKGDKAAFALNVLDAPDINGLKPPDYIHNGLDWLRKQLVRVQTELVKTAVSIEA